MYTILEINKYRSIVRSYNYEKMSDMENPLILLFQEIYENGAEEDIIILDNGNVVLSLFMSNYYGVEDLENIEDPSLRGFIISCHKKATIKCEEQLEEERLVAQQMQEDRDRELYLTLKARFET